MTLPGVNLVLVTDLISKVTVGLPLTNFDNTISLDQVGGFIKKTCMLTSVGKLGFRDLDLISKVTMGLLYVAD